MTTYQSHLTPVVRAVAIVALLACGLAQPAFAADPLLTKVRSGNDVTIALLGTSLTDRQAWTGTGTGFLQDWLNSESGGGTITVHNFAVGGTNSDHGLSTQTPNALAVNPDAVFIEFGINDGADVFNMSLAHSQSNLNAMIDAFLTQDPTTTIILQTMNNVAADTGRFSPRSNLSAYYQIYQDTAAARGLTLIDNYPNWLEIYNNDLATWETYMRDEVHPSELGQANVLMPELKAVLTAEAEAVPEPASLTMGLLGFAGLLIARRRR